MSASQQGGPASTTPGREIEPKSDGFRRARVACMSASGAHFMSYAEWGEPDNPRMVICAHGLTHNGRVFDALARELARDFRVVCPDVAGRGASDWLTDASCYGVPQYASDMMTLIRRLKVESVDWLGTSMGGLIGMSLAAQADSPIRSLILNDVGPVLSAVALARIAAYVGAAPKFADLDEAEFYLREISRPFGPLSDSQWRTLTIHLTRPRAAGGLEMAYDPKIAEPFQQIDTTRDIALWEYYDAIVCPTLVIRGADSDLLPPEVVGQMSRRGPRAQVCVVPGVGHAPMFMDRAQIAIVERFLRQGVAA